VNRLVRFQRISLAEKRIENILSKHKIVLARTLEQKISDAGPTNQRIDPHILTLARKEMQRHNKVQVYSSKGVAWYYLSGTPKSVIEKRLSELEPIHQALQQRSFTTRVGQALEIAVYRALLNQDVMEFFGHFRDLDEHGDDQLYSKEEPLF